MSRFQTFIGDDSGAITIDWVSLTAGILLLGIAVIYAIFNTGVQSVAVGINDGLASVGIVDSGTAPDLNGGGGGGGSAIPTMADGTVLPTGSGVAQTGTGSITPDGPAIDYVLLMDPNTGIVTLLTTSAGSGALPPAGATVSSDTTITGSTDGGSSTTYNMSDYSTSYSGSVQGLFDYINSQQPT